MSREAPRDAMQLLQLPSWNSVTSAAIVTVESIPLLRTCLIHCWWPVPGIFRSRTASPLASTALHWNERLLEFAAGAQDVN